MKRNSLTLSCRALAASAILGLVTQSNAAEPYSAYANEPLPRAVVPFGGEGSYSDTGSEVSTYEESLLQGEAALRRATGEQALYTAEALRSYEAAVDQALDNKVKRLAVRQERARMARMHLAEMERIKLARQAEARARRQETADTAATPPHVEHAANRERHAASKLELARRLKQQGRTGAAQRWMADIIRDYPGTAAAREVSMMIAGQ